MHWPLQNAEMLSLHGRAIELLHPHILPGNKIFALTSNKHTMIKVAELLIARKYGKSLLCVLENLGGAVEQRTTFTAEQFDQHSIGNFYVLAIDCVPDQDAILLTSCPGLPDTVYDVHDGQLTTSQVRSTSLAAPMRYSGTLA